MKECVPVLRSNNTSNGKTGEPFTKSCGAVTRKLDLLMTEHYGPRPEGMLIRHLCENDSSAPNGFVCCNPEHLAWGTVSENTFDTIKDGKHFSIRYPERAANHFKKMNATLLTCPHCGVSMNVGCAKQWHFDKCKHKTIS